ncbi:MAG: hypothetical protein H7Y17_01795 [Chlorobia bacterium]|nr:hypothetical protein [Fimbriimonadaceae bacterium]
MADRILVRFNTKVADDPEGRAWRVLVNGVETLAHKVHIEVPCESITEPIATGEIKHHFLCRGRVRWSQDHVATVVAVRSVT